MTEYLVAAVLVSVPLLGLGYLMKRYKFVEVIAGYDPKKVKDKDGLATWVGNNLILMGLSAIAWGMIQLYLPWRPLTVILVLPALILLIAARTVLGTRRYER